MSVDCAALRHTFGDLLRTHVPAAAAVFDEEPGDLTDASPALVISRAGRNRPRLSMRDGQTLVTLYLDCFFTASAGADGYTAADSADTIDAVAQQIDTLIDSHRTNRQGGWQAIAQGDSAVELGIFNADGVLRFRERVPLTFTLFG